MFPQAGQGDPCAERRARQRHGGGTLLPPCSPAADIVAEQRHDRRLGHAHTRHVGRHAHRCGARGLTRARRRSSAWGSCSPLADSIAATLVFELKTQRNFLAASRAKRVLVDLGRVDAPLKTPQRQRAFQEAVKVLSPVHIGDRFRLHGSWGQDDATVQSFDQWNGRIVGVLAVTAARRLAREGEGAARRARGARGQRHAAGGGQLRARHRSAPRSRRGSSRDEGLDAHRSCRTTP